MRYEATQQSGLHVQATCENCGSVYTYVYPLKVSMKASTREEAGRLVGDAAFEAMRIRRDTIEEGDFNQLNWWLWRDGLGYNTCPRCGYMQSWQVKVSQAQLVRRIATGIAVLAGVGVFLALMLNADYLKNTGIIKLGVCFFIAAVVGPVIFVIAGAVLLGPVMLLYRPNRKFQSVTTVNKPVLIPPPAAPVRRRY